MVRGRGWGHEIRSTKAWIGAVPATAFRRRKVPATAASGQLRQRFCLCGLIKGNNP